MDANGLHMGSGWLFWTAWVALPVVLFAVLAVALAFRWRRLRGVASGPLGSIDPRRVRFEQAAGRPRKRRMAMLDTPVSQVLPAGLKSLQSLGQSLSAAANRRPGLTHRWKGDHRIAIR